MSSIQMNSKALLKYCYAYMVWTEIAFRYKQAMILKEIKESKGWFKRQKYKTYDEAKEALNEMSRFQNKWFLFMFTPYEDNRDRVSELILLCQNGNPVTVTTNDAFVLQEVFRRELCQMRFSDEKIEDMYYELYYR